MKLTYPAMVAAVLICLTVSCNKKDDAPVKSVEDLVKGKAWSGDIKYAGEWADQVFYVQFNNGDNKFTWTEARGTYGGTYAIDEVKRELKITFDGSGSKVSITINEEEKIMGINYGGSYGWFLENVEQNTSAGDVLENTSWQGIRYTDGVGPDNDYSLKFISGTTVIPKSSSGYPYSRSGPCIKGTFSLYNVFMVVNKNKINGIWIYNATSKFTSRFEVTKQ